MIDLDALKARVLRPEHGGFMPDLCLVSGADIAALIAEVERLCEERDAAAYEASTLRDENGTLREQVADLQLMRDEHLMDNENAMDEGRDKERAAVVAWLERQGGRSAWTLVEAVRKGEHRWGETKP
jgi:hypothetical protein